MESDQSSSHKFKRTTRSNSSKLGDVGMDDLGDPLATYTNEKRMKKDDSGITVDNVQCSSSDDDDNEGKSREASFNSGLTVGSTLSVNVGKSELNSPDSGNQESVSLNDFHENTSPEVDGGVADSSDTVSAKPADKESDREVTDSVEPQNESACSHPSKDSEKKNYDPTPNVPRPKHKWVAPKAALLRQYGTSVQYSPNYFRYDCYGSLHMVERLELMYKMRKHDGCVNTLNFNSSGTKLVSGSDDLDVIIWDWTVSEPILEYNTGHRSNVFQAKFLPLSGDCQIVSCARDGQVRIAELSVTGVCKSTRKLAQHRGAAHKLAVQLDSPHTFISCGEDAAVFEIDLREGKPEKLVVCRENNKKVPLYSVFINPNKSYEYAVGGRDQYVRVYDKRCIHEEDGFLKKYCPEHLVNGEIKANVTSVVYSYNGEEILASYNDEDIYLFDALTSNTSQFLHRYRGHRNSQTVKGVNFFGPKSEYVISGSDCGYVFFWEKESEHIVKYMHGDEGGVVNCLEPNPNMPVLATSGLDDDIKIWVPSCENAPDLSGLQEHISSNIKDREEERRAEPDLLDDEMILYLMQHIRRVRRRTQSGGVFVASSSSSSDSESEDDVGFRPSVQCSQS